MIITIDGPSGTGKSTVARAVAKRLGFTFFDTGAMYRSFAWFVLIKKEALPENEEQIGALVKEFDFQIASNSLEEKRYLVHGEDITFQIRSPQISQAASQIASYAAVREALVHIQREFGKTSNAVFEGRDMGTVVFPHADLKIFLTADPEIRARRRFDELVYKFPDLSLSFEDILKETLKRDQADSTRSLSPLKKAPDSVLIDTSTMNIDQVIQKILTICPKKKYPKKRVPYALCYWAARLFFKIFFRLEIYGEKHFIPGPGVIASNHVSNYDPPVLSISCPEEVHFLAKASLFKVPFLSFLIRTLNSHPVKRGSSDASVFRLMLSLVQEGKKLILFPEGKRSETGEILPLERGLGFFVQKAKCPIIPAYIQGTHDAWPAKKKMPRFFGKIRVVFGSPIYWSDIGDKKEAQDTISKKTESAIRGLKKWLEEGAHGTPP